MSVSNTFTEDQIDALIAKLFTSDLVVGFNCKRFDYAVLSPYTSHNVHIMPNILNILEDIHNRLGYRLSLDHLAQEPLIQFPAILRPYKFRKISLDLLPALTLFKTEKQFLKKGAYLFDSEYITNSGETIPIETNSRVLEFNGETVILSISRNLAKRKEMERKVLSSVIQTEEKERERFQKI